MLLKRKKKEEPGKCLPPLLMNILVRCNEKLIGWATYLQQKASGLSARKLKWLLITFSLLFLCASTWNIISSVRQKVLPFQITPIPSRPLVLNAVSKEALTDQDFLRLRRLRRSLDSLAGTPLGRRCLDSLLQRHPRLLDTLSYLENSYFRQHKK